jgi:hypothetical protein
MASPDLVVVIPDTPVVVTDALKNEVKGGGPGASAPGPPRVPQEGIPGNRLDEV